MESVTEGKQLSRRQAPGFVLGVLGYIVLARLSSYFAFPDFPLIGVWLPAGLALGLVLINDYAVLPTLLTGIFLSALMGNWTLLTQHRTTGLMATLAFTLINLIEPFLIVFIYRKLAHRRHPLHDYRGFLWLMGAVTLGCLITALAWIFIIRALGLAPVMAFSESLLTAWMAPFLGILMVAPVILATVEEAGVRHLLKRPLEWIPWLLGLLFIATVAHLQQFEAIYLVLPLMAWAATRFSLAGSMLAIGGAALVAVSQILVNHAQGHSPTDRALLEEALVLIMTGVSCYVRSLLEDRKRVKTSLERTVEERTRELQLMNFELRDEIFVRQQAEKSFRRSSRHYRALVETASNPILVIDEKCRIRQWNSAAESLYGYGREDAKGLNLLEAFIPEAHQDEMAWKITKVLTSGVLRETVETEAFGYDGSRHIMLWNINLLPNDDAEEAPQIILVGQDITEIRDTQDKLHYLAHYDALTGTANRRLFEDRCRQAIESALRYGHDSALISIDVDHFKRINDTLGHDAGDELLRTLSERLEGSVRREDTIARLGGDEFAVLLNKVNGAEGCERVARHILRAVTEPIHVRGAELVVTTSVGITLAPNDGSRYEELLKNADMAMYRAKKAGRNNIQFFSPDMNEELQRQIQMEVELREALANRQLDLFYQPVIDLQSGEIVAMEALMRWQHPERGLLQPEDFLDVAEQTGLLARLGDWAFLNGCLQARAIQAMSSRSILVGINLSEKQYNHPQLPQSLEKVIRDTRVDPHLISLEIDEKLLRERPDDAVTLLHQLKQLGVRLVLDKFGSGLSSIRLLGELPFDHVKLDRGLLASVAENPNAAAIVRTLINLARQLSLIVIANGVESAAQEQILKAAGCDLAQGHRFSPAIPSDQLGQLFQHARNGHHLLRGNQFNLPLTGDPQKQ